MKQYFQQTNGRLFVTTYFWGILITISNDTFQEQTSNRDATNGGSGASTPITPTQESIALKKALEWELSLDKSDLRSHAWYYASITRQRADELIEKDGDFLVRDCVSQPGKKDICKLSQALIKLCKCILFQAITCCLACLKDQFYILS